MFKKVTCTYPNMEQQCTNQRIVNITNALNFMPSCIAASPCIGTRAEQAVKITVKLLHNGNIAQNIWHIICVSTVCT